MDSSITASAVAEWLPRRLATSHKGTFGKLTIVAGCRQYRGAAILAVKAAQRIGTGIVQLASTEETCAAAVPQANCCVMDILPSTSTGGIAHKTFMPKRYTASTAFVVGCGMGNSIDTYQIVMKVLQSAGAPAVLDADALNVLAGHMDYGEDREVRKQGLQALCDTKRKIILTPHIGEMARICEKSIEEVAVNQKKIALKVAVQYGCTVALKSHVTVVASDDGSCRLDDQVGNAGMAKGGSGDVLAGIMGGLLAQGLPPQQAAAAGVWIHGAVGDAVAKEYGKTAMLPSDMPENMWRVLKNFER